MAETEGATVFVPAKGRDDFNRDGFDDMVVILNPGEVTEIAPRGRHTWSLYVPDPSDGDNPLLLGMDEVRIVGR